MDQNINSIPLDTHSNDSSEIDNKFDLSLNDSHTEVNNIFPISEEYDMMRKNYFCKDTIDRSKWMEKLFSNLPDIKQFREQVLPIDRTIEFGNLYLPDERILNQGSIFSLISQHFHTLGLLNSQQTLQKEWTDEYDYPISLNKSQLSLLIQRGIQNVENIWLLSTPGTMPNLSNEEILNKKVLKEFEKIIGKEIIHTSNADSDVVFEEPDDLIKFNFDDEGNLSKATIDQLIWICTNYNKLKTKELTQATCLLSSLFTENCNIMFAKIRHRFKIALNSEAIINNLDFEISAKSENSIIDEKSSSSQEKEKNLSEKQLSSEFQSKSDNLFCLSEADNQLSISSISLDLQDYQSTQIILTLKFLSIWIEQCSLQITPSVFSSIISFLNNDVPTEYDKTVKQMQDQIKKIIIFRKKLLSQQPFTEKKDDQSTTLQPPPKVELDSHHMPWSINFELTMLPPIEFARQLTLFMSRYFYNIKRYELIYSKDENLSQNQPNLNTLITKSNNFFRWLQFHVLSKSDINNRFAALSYFIKVARKLYKMRNYYGCSLILNAFDNSFHFLKATKAFISKTDLSFISEAKDKLTNFTIDSSILRQFFRDELLSGPVIPVIYPYRSPIVSSIKSRLIEGQMVNVPVLLEIHRIVCEFEKFQEKKFNFYEIEQAQDIFDECNSPKSLNELIDYAKKLE